MGNYTDEANVSVTPNQLRWSPFDLPTEPTDFVEGLHSIAGAGDVGVRHGMAVLIFAANKSMEDTAFQNSDGDFLIGKEWILTAPEWSVASALLYLIQILFGICP